MSRSSLSLEGWRCCADMIREARELLRSSHDDASGHLDAGSRNVLCAFSGLLRAESALARLLAESDPSPPRENGT